MRVKLNEINIIVGAMLAAFAAMVVAFAFSIFPLRQSAGAVRLPTVNPGVVESTMESIRLGVCKMGASMESTGWMIVGGVVVCLISMLIGRLTAPRNDCVNCGIADLKDEVRRQSKLIQAIAEKAGFTVKERLEIEGM
jgi:hypothetical protein